MSAGIGTIERQGNEGKQADEPVDNISIPLDDNSRVLQEDLHIEEERSPEGSASTISQEAMCLVGIINYHPRAD